MAGRFMSGLTDVMIHSATEITGLGINIYTRRVRSDRNREVSRTLEGFSWVEGKHSQVRYKKNVRKS